MGKRPGQLAVFVGLACALAGFVIIALSWNFAAELDYIQGQFPYLVSGGLTGISLVVVGIAIIVIQILRADGAEQAKQLNRLVTQIEELQAILVTPDEYEEAAAAGEFRPRPRTQGNGQGAGEAPTEPIPSEAGTWEQG